MFDATVNPSDSIATADPTERGAQSSDDAIQDLYLQTKTAFFDYDRRLGAALTSARSQQMAALTSVYELHCKLQADPDAREKLYRDLKLRVDVRTKYAVQPLIRHLVGVCGQKPELRNRISVWSGAVEAIKAANIAPAEFADFVEQHGGLDAIYRDAVKASRGKSTQYENAVQLERALTSYRGDVSPCPLAESHFTEHLTAGKYLLIIDRDHDGNTNIVARLDRDSTAVERMFDQHVLKWAKSTWVDQDD